MSAVPPGIRGAVWAQGSDAPEKKEVKIGFIPLTDCASVVSGGLTASRGPMARLPAAAMPASPIAAPPTAAISAEAVRMPTRTEVNPRPVAARTARARPLR